MNDSLKKLYQSALLHREIHQCGAVPYQNGDLLIELVKKHKVIKILEIGTGVGYSTICLALGNKNAKVETVDKDAIHIMFAKENCRKFNLSERILFHQTKAEDLFPKLTGEYDLIFYDGHVPQKKFVTQFEKLLKKEGVAVTTNLFLSSHTVGKYLKLLQTHKWDTRIIEDTAISIKQ